MGLRWPMEECKLHTGKIINVCASTEMPIRGASIDMGLRSQGTRSPYGRSGYPVKGTGQVLMVSGTNKIGDTKLLGKGIQQPPSRSSAVRKMRVCGRTDPLKCLDKHRHV